MGPSKFILLILLFTLIFSIHPSHSSLTTFIYKGCANQKFQDPSSIYTQNLQSLYQTLITQSSSSNYYNTTTGNSQLPTSITGLYQCRNDLSTSACSTCVKKIPETIQKVCGGDTIAARVQLEGCYMMYEIVGFPAAGGMDVLFKECGSGRASGSGFDTRLGEALGEVEKGVVSGKGFYSGVYESVNVLGQCEGDLGSGECGECVKAAVANARSACGSSISGQIYLQKCFIAYKYYPNGIPRSGTGGGGGIQTGETETGGGGGKRNTQKTVAIIIGGLAGLFLGIAFLLVLRSAFKKKKEKHSHGHYGGY